MRSHQTIHYEFAKGPIAVGMGNGLHRIGHSRPRLDLVVKATNCDTYRIGFNGHEKTDEISGYGNHNTAMYWEYDTRLGSRWNVDPKPIPTISNYACFGNNPIQNYDILGDSLDAANNDASKNDIKNLTPNNAYIVFKAKENGTVAVKLDFKGLSPDETAKLLIEYAGLSFLNDMCNAPEK